MEELQSQISHLQSELRRVASEDIARFAQFKKQFQIMLKEQKESFNKMMDERFDRMEAMLDRMPGSTDKQTLKNLPPFSSQRTVELSVAQLSNGVGAEKMLKRQSHTLKVSISDPFPSKEGSVSDFDAGGVIPQMQMHKVDCDVVERSEPNKGYTSQFEKLSESQCSMEMFNTKQSRLTNTKKPLEMTVVAVMIHNKNQANWQQSEGSKFAQNGQRDAQDLCHRDSHKWYHRHKYKDKGVDFMNGNEGLHKEKENEVNEKHEWAITIEWEKGQNGPELLKNEEAVPLVCVVGKLSKDPEVQVKREVVIARIINGELMFQWSDEDEVNHESDVKVKKLKPFVLLYIREGKVCKWSKCELGHILEIVYSKRHNTDVAQVLIKWMDGAEILMKAPPTCHVKPVDASLREGHQALQQLKQHLQKAQVRMKNEVIKEKTISSLFFANKTKEVQLMKFQGQNDPMLIERKNECVECKKEKKMVKSQVNVESVVVKLFQVNNGKGVKDGDEVIVAHLIEVDNLNVKREEMNLYFEDVPNWYHELIQEHSFLLLQKPNYVVEHNKDENKPIAIFSRKVIHDEMMWVPVIGINELLPAWVALMFNKIPIAFLSTSWNVKAIGMGPFQEKKKNLVETYKKLKKSTDSKWIERSFNESTWMPLNFQPYYQNFIQDEGAGMLIELPPMEQKEMVQEMSVRDCARRVFKRGKDAEVQMLIEWVSKGRFLKEAWSDTTLDFIVRCLKTEGKKVNWVGEYAQFQIQIEVGTWNYLELQWYQQTTVKEMAYKRLKLSQLRKKVEEVVQLLIKELSWVEEELTWKDHHSIVNMYFQIILDDNDCFKGGGMSCTDITELEVAVDSGVNQIKGKKDAVLTSGTSRPEKEARRDSKLKGVINAGQLMQEGPRGPMNH